MGWTWWHSGLLVTVLAVLVVVTRVLWPKEFAQRLRASRRFRSSVSAMREGLRLLAQERYDAALIRFQEAARQTPGKPAPALLRVYALGLQGRRREAAHELQRARNHWPAPTLPRRLLALAELGAGEFDRAYATAQAAAAADPTNPDVHGSLGDICRLLERYPEAERAYRAGMRLKLPTPHAGLAWCLAWEGRVEEAEDVLAQTPPLALDRFEARLCLGQIHLRARRLDDAATVLRSLLSGHGDVPRVLVPYGLTLLELGQPDEARAALEHAVAISPHDAFAHGALAALLADRDELAGATRHIREALRIWPGYGAARGTYGDILKRNSRYAAAEEQYRDALRLNPFLPEIHTRLAALLRASGNVVEAHEHEREAERLRPAAPRAITQEILAITTRELAAVRVAIPAPLTTPRSRRAARQELDLPVFPGAALLFDEISDGAISQTLQADQPPNAVLAFYRQRMTEQGWTPRDERGDETPRLPGLTLRFARGAQVAAITVGVRDHQTVIATSLDQGAPLAPRPPDTVGA